MGEFASGTVAKAGGGDFELIPPGLYVARCFQVIDMGVQETPFEDEDGIRKNSLRIRLGWEVLQLNGEDFRQANDKPFIVTEEFTNSIHEKSKLRPFLEQWRGKPFTAEELSGFDVLNVLGAYCQLQVMHKPNAKGDKVYPVVSAALPYSAKEKPEPINPNQQFNIMNWDQAIFDTLPKFLQDKIKTSLTYKYELTDEQKDAILAAGADTDKPKGPLDTVITDINDDEEINLDDIPF